MRVRLRKTGALVLVTAVIMLLFQAGIQLLHVHYSNSCYDQQDGFHTLSTTITCPAASTHANTQSESVFLLPSSFDFYTPSFTCSFLVEPVARKPEFGDSASKAESRASPA
jgi:hypothetical protein